MLPPGLKNGGWFGHQGAGWGPGTVGRPADQSTVRRVRVQERVVNLAGFLARATVPRWGPLGRPPLPPSRPHSPRPPPNGKGTGVPEGSLHAAPDRSADAGRGSGGRSSPSAAPSRVCRAVPPCPPTPGARSALVLGALLRQP